MGHVSLTDIDWSHPWLAPIQRLRAVLEAGAPMDVALSDLAKAHRLCTGFGQPLRFVAPDDAGDTPYELHIARTGRVPTRGNFHDLFNAAVWLTMPSFKAAMNARQARCILNAPPQNDTDTEQKCFSRRGADRDAATLLDESGLILAVDATAHVPDVHACLKAHDWHTVFIAERARWHTHWVPWLVGHAVLEKLMRPYVAMTVRVQVVRMAQKDLHNPRAVDAAAARLLTEESRWTPAQWPPMPVLGIPGWWPDNARPDFYNDASVFRTVRQATRSVG